VVNGQKVWTSYADKSDWIFALVRTEADAPKYNGISFLLIDMDQPGVSTKPIKLISRQVAVLRDLLRRRQGAGEEPCRRSRPGLGDRQIPPVSHERAGIVSEAAFGGLNPVSAAHQSGEVEEDGKLADPILRGEVAR
jgi:acyl-CoA dehydrogenase